MKGVFLNCTNHTSNFWNEEQKKEALKYGKIVDYPFPSVDAGMTEGEIVTLAQKAAKEIVKINPAAVLCQGEFTLTYQLINMLKKEGIVVLAACSERKTVERVIEDGMAEKISMFKFVKYRKY